MNPALIVAFCQLQDEAADHIRRNLRYLGYGLSFAECQEVLQLFLIEQECFRGDILRPAINEKRLDHEWYIILLGKYDSPLVLQF